MRNIDCMCDLDLLIILFHILQRSGCIVKVLIQGTSTLVHADESSFDRGPNKQLDRPNVLLEKEV